MRSSPPFWQLVGAADRPRVARDHSGTVGLTADEVDALLAAAAREQGSTAPRNRAIVALLADLGLRVGEVVALDLADLGHEQGHRTVRPAGTTGTGTTSTATRPTRSGPRETGAGTACDPVAVRMLAAALALKARLVRCHNAHRAAGRPVHGGARRPAGSGH